MDGVVFEVECVVEVWVVYYVVFGEDVVDVV